MLKYQIPFTSYYVYARRLTDNVITYMFFTFYYRLHGATEVIDEILSDEENKDEKRLKDAELIMDNKHVKEIDNRYREEQGDIVLIKRDDPNLRVDEKHQVEQMVKEETVENVAVEAENETHEVVINEPKNEVKGKGSKPAVTSPTKSSLKTVDFNVLKLRNTQNTVPDSSFRPIKESVSFGDVKSIDSKQKDSNSNFKAERRVSIQDFAEIHEENKVVEKCNNEPDPLVSRAPLTFALMQTEDKTPDDHLDENATRAAPYTVASQWNASQFPSSSESHAEDESDGEVGGSKNKSQLKKIKRFQHNTLMDEEDMKMDSVLRNSLVLADGDGQDCLRNSLVFLGDDSAALSANESDNDKKHGVKSKSSSFAEKSKHHEKSVGTSSISHKLSGPSKMPEKLVKEMDNLISSPLRNSPTKHLFKPKESLTDLKKLATLSHIKTVTSKPPPPQPLTTKKDLGTSVDKPTPVKPALKPKPKQLPNLKVLVGVGSSVDKISDEGSSVDGDRKTASVSNVDVQVNKKDKHEELESNSSFLSHDKFCSVSLMSNKQSLKPLEEKPSIANSTQVSSNVIETSIDNLSNKLGSINRKPEDIKISESVTTAKRELPLPASQIPVKVDKSSKHSLTDTVGSEKQIESNKEVVKNAKTDTIETLKVNKHGNKKFSEKEIQRAEIEHLRARKKMSPIVEERNGEINSKSAQSVEQVPSSTKSTSSEPSVGKEENVVASAEKNQVERRHSFNVDIKSFSSQLEKKFTPISRQIDLQTEAKASSQAEKSPSLAENRISSHKNDPGNKKPVRRRSSSASRIPDRTANELREALAAVTPTPPETDPSKVPKPPPGAAPKNTVLLNAR